MSLSIAIFHLFVPIRTNGICELSQFDATNITVGIAETLQEREFSNFMLY
jgi:hypothetical protein